jgi:large subunit ribosomal protein L22
MEKTATVKLNYLRMTPRKVRAVADLLRGLSVNEAEAQLFLQRRRPAKPLLKLLRSAVASAKNGKLNVDKLVIGSIRVDQGPMLKRHLPRARGMATPIQKKMAHVMLVLREEETLAKPRFIVLPPEKKVKKEKRARVKEEKPRVEERSTPAREKRPGFWRRMFRRKSV